MTNRRDYSIEVKRYRLSPAIEPYFTALYVLDFDCAPDVMLEDIHHPEWTGMRFSDGPPPMASLDGGPLKPQWPFVFSGPTSTALHFGIRKSRIWGLGLHPIGWAKFAKGQARDVANRTADGMTHPALELFRPILEIVTQQGAEPDAVAEQIDRYLSRFADKPCRAEGPVLACQNALRDPDVANVADLGRRVGLGNRALERLCRRYFGFGPKMLLRRQRFNRSLARYMLESDRTWSEAIDEQYYDQAQFVKDFRAFMGITPSEYAEMPHPVLETIMADMMEEQGAAPQTDLPTVLRYASPA